MKGCMQDAVKADRNLTPTQTTSRLCVSAKYAYTHIKMLIRTSGKDDQFRKIVVECNNLTCILYLMLQSHFNETSLDLKTYL